MTSEDYRSQAEELSAMQTELEDMQLQVRNATRLLQDVLTSSQRLNQKISDKRNALLELAVRSAMND